MLCDRFRLGNGRWVRADGQDLLQTEPQPHELCGTRYPIWMKGMSFTKNYKVFTCKTIKRCYYLSDVKGAEEL